jgi:hypothetical protein
MAISNTSRKILSFQQATPKEKGRKGKPSPQTPNACASAKEKEYARPAKTPEARSLRSEV